jgi:hypothetical protein
MHLLLLSMRDRDPEVPTCHACARNRFRASAPIPASAVILATVYLDRAHAGILDGGFWRGGAPMIFASAGPPPVNGLPDVSLISTDPIQPLMQSADKGAVMSRVFFGSGKALAPLARLATRRGGRGGRNGGAVRALQRARARLRRPMSAPRSPVTRTSGVGTLHRAVEEPNASRSCSLAARRLSKRASAPERGSVSRCCRSRARPTRELEDYPARCPRRELQVYVLKWRRKFLAAEVVGDRHEHHVRDANSRRAVTRSNTSTRPTHRASTALMTMKSAPVRIRARHCGKCCIRSARGG